jgi:hypothetical protein
MREPLNAPASCPNCNSQVVLYRDGFECSTCGYTSGMWAAFLVTAPYPMHIDSPALLKTGDSYQVIEVDV